MLDFSTVKIIAVAISFFLGYWLRKEYVLRRVIADFVRTYGLTFSDAFVTAYLGKCGVCSKKTTIALLRFVTTYRLVCSNADHNGSRTIESFTAPNDDVARDKFFDYINSR